MHTSSPARLAIALLISVLAAGCGVQPGSGHGRVLDAVSKLPVVEAQVRAFCSVASGWHGVKSIEHTATSTAPDGAYYVDPVNFRGCADIHVFASKPGYVPNDFHISRVADEGRGIPEIVYVMNVADVPRLQLDDLWQGASVLPIEAGPYAVANFASLYRAFDESRRIANSPEQAVWVRDRYCMRLHSMFALLSAPQRAELDRVAGFRAGADDYRTLVVPNCAQ